MIFAKMTTRQRLLALLEIYDTAIEELYVLGDRGLVALILRLERRRMEAHRGLLSLRGIRRPVCGGTQMGEASGQIRTRVDRESFLLTALPRVETPPTPADLGLRKEYRDRLR
jgi:hypothetical protein